MKLMKVSALCLLMGFALMVISCAGTSSRRASESNEQAAAGRLAPSRMAATRADQVPEKVVQHWVQNAQLRGVMKDLSAKTQRNWPQDPEEQQSDSLQDSMNAAAKLADGLCASAVLIPASVRGANMNDSDRAGFQAEADNLCGHAMSLGQAARAKKVEQMQRSLDAINSTCISCHSRYRDFTGQLDIQQLSAR